MKSISKVSWIQNLGLIVFSVYGLGTKNLKTKQKIVTMPFAVSFPHLSNEVIRP
jgi:hypothetical protein